MRSVASDNQQLLWNLSHSNPVSWHLIYAMSFGRFPSSRRLDIVVGVGLCAVAAALLAELFAGRSSQNLIPLAFVAVIVFLAARYGATVGIFGSLAAALIFSIFMFAPLNSVRVRDDAARANIGWMLLAGIALSYLLSGPPQTPKNN